MHDLGETRVSDINASGDVTGALGCKAVILHGDTVKNLGHFGSPFTCAAGVAINDSGQVTGHTGSANGRLTAFLYSDGVMIDLGALSDDRSTSGTAINNLGQAVSYGAGFGFLYSEGEMLEIETPDANIYPWGINDLGQVVGQASPKDNRAYAFVYNEGEIFNLNDLVVDLPGWEYLYIARDINMSGQIIGNGKLLNGKTHGFLLTPLPISASR
jgi:probable HAF family extracellular repeat protein